ncbi:MAG TPA: hypothetical protein VG055_00040 [Planctomycetaceae bacterium]|jgi:hypothetical protein|nr:hypothetical protein [Planctomycetaceae bacterium]
MVSKQGVTSLSNSEIRRIILRYLFERNANARSARSDRTGAAVKISVMRGDLKLSNGLTQKQVRANLTYLISQGWVEEQAVNKSVPTPRGGIIPSITSYYIITAAGIDKFEGPGEFTMDRFHGIKIEATGQNIITVGDGNQVNARFADAAQGLADLKEAVKGSTRLTESEKVDVVGDIDSIQGQLAKAEPNKSVISALWSGIEKAAKVAGLAANVVKVGNCLEGLLS